jgi:hypothetical protein
MADFELHTEQAREIERKGIALGIDWSDELQLRELAHEAMQHFEEHLHRASSTPHDRKQMAKIELFGLAALMLKTMTESATRGFETHGGDVWKAFARALWAEKALRDASSDRGA